MGQKPSGETAEAGSFNDVQNCTHVDAFVGLRPPASSTREASDGVRAVAALTSFPIAKELAQNELRIRVTAAAVTRGDYRKLLQGFTGIPTEFVSKAAHQYSRDAPFALQPLKYPYIVGTDGCGIVEAVGESVTNFTPGDRVVFYCDSQRREGAMAAHTIVEDHSVIAVPQSLNASVSDSEIAALPSSAWVAYAVLFDKLRVERGRTIFIRGAAGGVGHVACQLAKYAGCRVIASSSPCNTSFLNKLGVDRVVDYTNEDACEVISQWTAGTGVDYFVDLVDSDEAVTQFLPSLRFGGSACLVAGPLSSAVPAYVAQRSLTLHFFCLSAFHTSSLTKPLLSQLAELVFRLRQSSVFNVYHEVVKREQLFDALEQVGGRHTKGRLVVRVA